MVSVLQPGNPVYCLHPEELRKSARQFRYNVEASMAGVNIGVTAPMSFFGFGGAKGSFFGDLKAHGREAFDFYTDRKVLMSRWD